MAKTKRPAPDFAPRLADFLRHLEASERSENTIRNYEADVHLFEAWYPSAYGEALTSLLQVTGVELRAWKQALSNGTHRPGQKPERCKPATVNRRLSAIQALMKWAGASAVIPGAPERPKNYPQERPGPKWLSRIEQNRLIRAVEGKRILRDIALVIFGLNTGLRVGELEALEWCDVTIGDRKGVVVVRRGKGAKYREVPLNADGREALARYGYAANAGSEDAIWQGRRGPLTANGIEQLVERYGLLSKLEGLTPHVLRHTFCKNLIDAGVGIEKVAALAGHDSIETTRRYVEPSQADLMDAVEQLGDRKRA